MTVRTRLKRLEVTARKQGLVCDGCRVCRQRRGHNVLVTGVKLPDGTAMPGPDAPLPCAACGEIPERLIEIVETVVVARQAGTRAEGRAAGDDLLALPGEGGQP
jgi:hypothetical protein